MRCRSGAEDENQAGHGQRMRPCSAAAGVPVGCLDLVCNLLALRAKTVSKRARLGGGPSCCLAAGSSGNGDRPSQHRCSEKLRKPSAVLAGEESWARSGTSRRPRARLLPSFTRSLSPLMPTKDATAVPSSESPLTVDPPDNETAGKWAKRRRRVGRGAGGRDPRLW